MDGVTNTTLQKLPDRGICFLVDLFNACPRNALLIPKPDKDTRQIGNLQPISLLSQTTKIFEHLVQRRDWDHFERLDTHIPEQFGFCENLSCIHQLMRLVEIICGAGFSGKQTFLSFLDMEEAFDNV